MKQGKNFQGVDKGSAGYKLLSAMGWKEGEGLGAKKQGITEHVKVKKKFDHSGVGAAEAAARARDWSLGMVSFESVLSGLKEVTSSHHSKSRGSRSDSSGSDSVEDTSEKAEEPKRKKQRARQMVAPQTPKAPKVGPTSGSKASTAPKAEPASSSAESESSSGSDSDSGLDSESESEARQQAVGRKKVASHIGRYRKRESAKMVKHYSSADLAAILGTNSATSTDTVVEAPPLMPPALLSKASNPIMEVPCKEEEDAKPDAVVEKEALAGIAAPAPSQPQWWSSMFVLAGGIGGQRNEPSAIPAPAKPADGPAINITGFSEQDQENLYNTAQGKRSQGRGGLGISEKPRMAAGSRWAGKKTAIVDSDDEADTQPEANNIGTVTAQQCAAAIAEPSKGSEDVIVVLPPLKPPSRPGKTCDGAGKPDGAGNAKGTGNGTGKIKGMDKPAGTGKSKVSEKSTGVGNSAPPSALAAVRTSEQSGKQGKKGKKAKSKGQQSSIEEGPSVEVLATKTGTPDAGAEAGRVETQTTKKCKKDSSSHSETAAKKKKGIKQEGKRDGEKADGESDSGAVAEQGVPSASGREKKGSKDATRCGSNAYRSDGGVDMGQEARKKSKSGKVDGQLCTHKDSGDKTNTSTQGEVGKLKWKSVVKKILKQQPKRKLKIRKLQQAALKAAEVAQDGAELATGAMMQELQKLGAVFEVTAKHVVLRA